MLQHCGGVVSLYVLNAGVCLHEIQECKAGESIQD